MREVRRDEDERETVFRLDRTLLISAQAQPGLHTSPTMKEWKETIRCEIQRNRERCDDVRIKIMQTTKLKKKKRKICTAIYHKTYTDYYNI